MNNKPMIFILILFTIMVFLLGFNIGKSVQRIDSENMIKSLKLK